MRKIKLDRIDRQILKDLQGSGRMSNVDLAGRVGISAPPCLRRVRALEKAGFIRGYHAELDASLLDYNVTVFAHVSLSNHAEHELKAFANMVETWPQVRESYMMTGDTDFMLKVVARDWDDYQNFLTDKLTAAPNVSHVKSNLSIRATKDLPGVPVEVE